MICQTCKELGELKVFSTFQYYYCSGCKYEIGLEQSPEPKLEVSISSDGSVTIDPHFQWDDSQGYIYNMVNFYGGVPCKSRQ